MGLLTKEPKVTTEARVTIAEIAEVADGFDLTAAEIAKRWEVRPDWAGRPSVSIADAAEVLAEGSGRYQRDRALRDRWNAFSSEVAQRRQAVANAAADAAEYAHRVETGGAIEHGRVIMQLRADAANKAAAAFDRAQPASMEEFARRAS